MILDWRREGAVSRRAKWTASLTMLLCAALMVWVSPILWLAGVGCAFMAAVALWLWRRPEPQVRTAGETVAPSRDAGSG